MAVGKQAGILLVLILLIGIVSASAFATIGMQGLSMASPESAEIVSNIICVSNPLLCLQGKVIGMVQGEALKALAEASPEAAQAVQTFNQVKGYLDSGAEVVEELQVDDKGQIYEGAIQFGEKEGRFGNLVGKDIEQKEIRGKDIKFEKKDGVSTITFTGDNSYLGIGEVNVFNNIKKQDEQTNAFVKLDNRGEVVGADFTANEKGGTYVIGNDRINLPPNSRLVFKDGKVELFLDKNKESVDFEVPTSVDSAKIGKVIEIRALKGQYIVLKGTETFAILSEGVIHIKDGQVYVPIRESAVINAVKITAIDDAVDMYFDGKEHSESKAYVSMDFRKRKLIAGAPKTGTGENAYFKIKPLEGNSFFSGSVEKTDNLVFHVFKGSRLSIQGRMEREGAALIPEVIVQTEQKIGDLNTNMISIENGENSFLLQRNKLLKHRLGSKGGSVPFVLKFQDMEGKNLLGTETEPQKFIVSDYGEFTTIPLESVWTTQGGEITRGFSKFRISNRLYSDSSSLNSLYDKGVSIVGGGPWKGKNPRDFLTKEQIREINGLVEFIPKNIRATKIIEIYPNDYWDKKNPESSGFVNSRNPEIIQIPERSINIKKDTFYHENLHTKHFSIEGSKWEKSWLKLDNSYGKDSGEYGPTVKEIFGISLSKNYINWEDGTVEPRYGFVRAYGANDKFEDVATVAPYIINSIQGKNAEWSYEQLINPKSKFYQERIGKKYATGVMDVKMAQRWSDVYLGKLLLSYEQGMITPAQHLEVLSKFRGNDFTEIIKRELEIGKRIR